jgi:5-methylcytosine-specific restriction endonuclease McrA
VVIQRIKIVSSGTAHEWTHQAAERRKEHRVTKRVTKRRGKLEKYFRHHLPLGAILGNRNNLENVSLRN